ncbi:hypothetical protein M3J07_011626 [Ascochyta lentis]
MIHPPCLLVHLSSLPIRRYNSTSTSTSTIIIPRTCESLLLRACLRQRMAGPLCRLHCQLLNRLQRTQRHGRPP